VSPHECVEQDPPHHRRRHDSDHTDREEKLPCVVNLPDPITGRLVPLWPTAVLIGPLPSEPYLAEHAAEGAALRAFYHRQLAEVVAAG
jgi:hypothetical protein